MILNDRRNQVTGAADWITKTELGLPLIPDILEIVDLDADRDNDGGHFRNLFGVRLGYIAKPDTLEIYEYDADSDSDAFDSEAETGAQFTLCAPENWPPSADQFCSNARGDIIYFHPSRASEKIVILPTYQIRGTSMNYPAVHVLIQQSVGTSVQEAVDEAVAEAIAGPIQDNIDAAIDALPPISQLAWLYDVKSTGTDGGSFNNGAWRTRDLNTLVSGPGVSWISRSGNQFSLLETGTYEIYASAPARAVEGHKAKLRNITDSTDDLIGTSEIASGGGAGANRSIIQGQIVIASAPKTFEIQHRCNTSAATLGFGAAAGFSVEEKYTIVKLQKIA